MSPRLGQVIEGIEAENYFLTQFLRDNATSPNLNSIYWPITSSSKCKMACEKNSFTKTGEGVGLGGLGKGRERGRGYKEQRTYWSKLDSNVDDVGVDQR